MRQNNIIKIKEISWCNPSSIFEIWQDKPWSLLFDSALFHDHYGRYSYIAVEPFQVLRAKDGHILIDNTPMSSQTNPFIVLKQLLAQMPQVTLSNLPPFQGGVAGAFSYDLYQYIENIPSHHDDKVDFPDLALGFYDVVISFDHQQKKAWIVSTGWPEKTSQAREIKATERLTYFYNLIKDKVQLSDEMNPTPHIEPTKIKLKSKLPNSNFQAKEYIAAVNRVIDYILAGDIFEANISQCFTANMPKDVSSFELYKRLRKINPAPFAAFINLGDIQVVSASPERFLLLENRTVESRPIKGTRSRGATAELDKQLAEELKASEKDHAENIMIVDLLRNDLSKVCQDHSIKVTQLCGLESYATVHHLVSVITGELKEDQDVIDLLLATFPGGSITGAPKIRAMQIIAEIEPNRRGIYCGSLGFIGFNGAMDTSIAIRTCTIKESTITFQAGGAIVVDSNPEEEYQETLVKSSAICRALEEQA